MYRANYLRIKVLFTCVLMTQVFFAQSIAYNNGVVLTIEAAVSVYCDDMGYTNQTASSIHGEIDNEGNFYIERDWTNNASGGLVFKNLNSTGMTHFTGNTPQQIGGSRTTTFENLTINNSSSGVTLRNLITVNETLTLTDGVLYTTASDIIVLVDDATASSGSLASFVDGPFEKQGNDAFTFPLGDNTTWARIGISAPSSNSTFIAQYFDASYSDTENVGTLNNVSTVEYWDLSRSAGISAITPTLYWENGTRSGIDLLSDLTVARYDGSEWVDETQDGGTTGSSSNGTVTGRSMSNFGTLTFGSGDKDNNPLPVELVSFDAELVNHEAILSWITASEIDNNYFTIQKSRDGLLWQHVFDVEGAGNSNTILTYQFIDLQPYSGQSYYRLKQTDFNGNFTYSDIRSIYVEWDNEFTFNLYPNPNNQEQVNIQFSADADDSDVLVLICDSQGRTVFNQRNLFVNQILSIDLSDLFHKGIYTVSVQCGDKRKTKKLIIN